MSGRDNEDECIAATRFNYLLYFLSLSSLDFGLGIGALIPRHASLLFMVVVIITVRGWRALALTSLHLLVARDGSDCIHIHMRYIHTTLL